MPARERAPSPSKAPPALTLPRGRVRELCVQRGYPWATSAARHVSGQQDYYEELLAKYKSWGRVGGSGGG